LPQIGAMTDGAAANTDAGLLRYVPFREPVPDRRVVLVWRKSFTRQKAIDAIFDAVMACTIPGVKRLDLPANVN
jgi:LysR family transcriptional regulator, hydrogen peroxide-inducible genes activator